MLLLQHGRAVIKRKTRVIRQTCHPQFHQTLLLEAPNPIGSTLIVSVCAAPSAHRFQLQPQSQQQCPARTSNRSTTTTCLSSSSSSEAVAALAAAPYHATSQFSCTDSDAVGVVHLSLDKLPLTFLNLSWYPLIPGYLFSTKDLLQ